MTAISLPTLFRGREIACSENKKLCLCCRVDQTPRQIKTDLACRLKRPSVYQPLQPGLGERGFLCLYRYFVTILRTTSFVTDNSLKRAEFLALGGIEVCP
jgi:hypothetical protein